MFTYAAQAPDVHIQENAQHKHMALQRAFLGKIFLEHLLFSPLHTPLRVLGNQKNHSIFIESMALIMGHKQTISYLLWALNHMVDQNEKDDSCKTNPSSHVDRMFKIFDPKGRFFNYLVTHPGVVKRNSTHFREHRAKQAQNNFAHVDFGLNIKNLPHGHQHILFNTYTSPITGERILFIQTEQVGFNIKDLSYQGIVANLAHSKDYLIHLLRKNEMTRRLCGLKSYHDPDCYTELTPPELLDAFETLLAQINHGNPGQYRHYAKKFGIQAMHKIIRDYQQQNPSLHKGKIKEFLNLSDMQLNYPDDRKGREIILEITPSLPIDVKNKK